LHVCSHSIIAPMKILYHHRTISKDGQNVHIEEMIAAFRHCGHEVCVVGPAGHNESTFGSDGGYRARLREMLPLAVGEVIETLYSVVAFIRLWSAYRRFRPDVIYERYNLFLLSGAWLKRLTKLPFVLEVNAPLVLERSQSPGLALRRLGRICERYVWCSADIVLPVTEILGRHLRMAGVPQSRIRVVMNGINRRHFPVGLSGDGIRTKYGLEGKTVIGFAGFLRGWHGLPAVVDVMRDLIGRYDIHFLVVGDGPVRDELMKHARERGVEKDITITGVVARCDMPSYIASFDIALQPKATSYASPLKLFEYMALGCAILAPDQANLREVLIDDVNALLFAPDDPQAFRSALQRLIASQALRGRLGAAAVRTTQVRELTWDSNARRIASALGASTHH